MANTTAEVSTENFYWASRMIAAMADAAYAKTSIYIERYRLAVGSKAHALIIKGDKAQQAAGTPEEKEKIREEINEEMAASRKRPGICKKHVPGRFLCSGVHSFFRLQFAKIIHFLYIFLVVDFTWLFYTKTMIRIKNNKK